MNELIKIDYNNDNPTVSSRELHEFLEVKDHYADWFKRMTAYGFAENTDYMSLSEKSVKPQGGRPTVNHQLTLDMAKEISMIQRNEKGKQIRTYFIKTEKAYREQQQKLISDLPKKVVSEFNQRIAALEEKVNKKITLDHAQQRALQNNVTKRVYARAFECAHNRTSDIQPIDIKANINKFFKAIYRDIKNQFGVTSYRDISANDFTNAIQCVQAWIEPTELRERVG